VRECEEVATNAIFRAIAVTTNVTREDEVKAMVEETMSTFGRIDYAANIAGVRWSKISGSVLNHATRTDRGTGSEAF